MLFCAAKDICEMKQTSDLMQTDTRSVPVLHTIINILSSSIIRTNRLSFWWHSYHHAINTCADRHKHHEPKNSSSFSPTYLCLFLSHSGGVCALCTWTVHCSGDSEIKHHCSSLWPLFKWLSSLWNNKCLYGWLSPHADGDLILKMAPPN